MAYAVQMNGFQVQQASVDGFKFAALWTKFQQYRLYRQTVSELRGLSGRELADLGLHRSAIKSVARESVYGA